jgi:hypothetical protein
MSEDRINAQDVETVGRRRFGRAVMLGMPIVAASVLLNEQGASAIAGDPWIAGGNASAATDTLGTTNATPLVIVTGGVERMRVDGTDGRVGIGLATPSANTQLHVRSTTKTFTARVDNSAPNGVCVLANATGAGGRGVTGQAAGTGGSAIAGYGLAPGTDINGVYGESQVANGRGVKGVATATGGEGVRGESTLGHGVRGVATGSSSAGVYGSNSAATSFGSGGFGAGVYGESTGGGLAPGIYGSATTNAVMGIASGPSGTGVFGQGINSGVYGVGDLTGVIGNGSIGVGGYSENLGVEGRGDTGVKGSGSGLTGAGVWGSSDAFTVGSSGGQGAGVFGENTASGTGAGVFGTSYALGVVGRGTGPGGVGVLGENTGNGYAGVLGQNTTNAGAGVLGTTSAANGFAVKGVATGGGWAGYFLGRVDVVGVLSKGSGTFKIDHPQDPANRYLVHSFVESPEMMNVYNGEVVCDEVGEAVVEMPSYFEALNRTFRYQLTPIGQSAPNLFIAARIADGRFRIGGGLPGLDVSWQVTGVRQDAFAQANPIVVEPEKADADRGMFLHPNLFGLDETRRIGFSKLVNAKGTA